MDTKDSNNLKGGEQMEIICEHCGYKWDTDSERMFVTCPNCMKKTRKSLDKK